MDPVVGNIVLAICFVVGSGLVILEAFMPGFGAAGISGLILEITAIVFTYKMYGTLWAVIATILVILLVGLAVFFSYRSAVNGRLSRSPLVLKNTENTAAETGSAPADSSRVGQEGTVATTLRPAGFIDIGGDRLNAATTGDFLEKGAAVVVIGTEGDHLVVRRK